MVGIAVAVRVGVTDAVRVGVGVAGTQLFEAFVAVTELPLSVQVTLVLNATGSSVAPATIESDPNLSASLGPLLLKIVPWPQFCPDELQPVAPENLFFVPMGR